MNAVDFSEWLRSTIETMGISQADLSRRSGLSPSQISKIMNMQSPPGKTALIAIADALGYPSETLMRIAKVLPPDPDFDADLDQLIQNYRDMDDEGKADLVAMSRAMRERREKQTWREKQREPKTQPRPTRI